MLDVEDGPLTFLRFGLQRKKEFLRDVQRAYDGLVLPANILLYQYRATPTSVFMCQKPFFVDPMSYLFGQPYDAFKQRVRKGPRFKPSFDRLMRGHGLEPEDFLPYDYRRLIRLLQTSGRNIENFSENAFEFQYDRVWNVVEEAADLMTDDERSTLIESDYRPRFVIPPYFLYEFQPNDRPTVATELNSRILEYCWGRRDSLGDIYPVVFIRKNLLGTKLLDRVTEIVTTFDFPGYCIWIEDFDERIANRAEARGLAGLTSILAGGGKQVVMLYGGFFSLLLYYFGMTCVCHGLNYGEWRSIGAAAQQGSGPAPIRYYILELHSALPLQNALLVLRERRDLLCSCPVCRRIVRGDPERVTLFENQEEMAEMHFLYNRAQERRMITEGNLQQALENLDWTVALTENLEEITKSYKVGYGYADRPVIDPVYIREWKEGLGDL